MGCGCSGRARGGRGGPVGGRAIGNRRGGGAGRSRRRMGRVIAPLSKMGANILAEGPEQTPPLRIRGGSLRGIHHRLPIASAQVKSALLLAGLFAKGRNTVDEPLPTPKHNKAVVFYFFFRPATE